MSQSTQHRSASATNPAGNAVASTIDAGNLLARGAIAGLTGGTAFILVNMWFAAGAGKPPVAPFLAISTIFDASAMPSPGPQSVVTGLVLHIGLSLAFGLGFAVLLTMMPRLRAPAMLVGAALIYGLALYVVNFQILGRTVFPFFSSPKGPNPVLELILHPVIFGLLLVPFFLGSARR